MKDEDVREDFCPACLAIPLAMAGAGASVAGSNKSAKFKLQKKVLLWGGIFTVLVSVAIVIYYICIKDCKDCR